MTMAKSTLPCRGHIHILGMQIVLDRHAHYESIDGRRVIHGIEPAVRVIVNVARIVPEPEVAVPTSSTVLRHCGPVAFRPRAV